MSDIKITNTKILRLLSGCLLLIFLQFSALAQLPFMAGDTARPARPVYPPDSLGRRTPRGTVDGFLKASYQNDYKKAALYIRWDPGLRKRQSTVAQAKALQALLEVNGRIYPYSWISNEPEGKTDDNLGPNLDRIGAVTIDNESFDLILESFQDKQGNPIWLFSTQTVGRIPLNVEEPETSTVISDISPQFLLKNKWSGVPIAHWIATIFLLVVSYLLAMGIARLVVYLIPKIYKRGGEEPYFGVIKAFSLPAQLYLAIWFFMYWGREAGISLVVRQRFSNLTLIVGVVAVILLIWQLLDVIGIVTEKRMKRYRNQSAVSAILFVRRAFKIALVIIGVILILDTLGFDVTTGIAALGIGGIALALGTQKTVENFVGSVTIIADQPVRVGDFCKIGEITGTIERIGMRATQVRTNDRTVVTIPNGELSSLKIENYAHRERFWFHPIFYFRVETTPDQIRQLIQDLRRVLLTHPRVNPDPARVRFIEVGLMGVKIEVFAYVDTGDANVFLEIQEELLLKMMDVIAGSGTSLTLPSQTIYFTKDPGLPNREGPVVSPE
ncbi:mechanosensitive ion channel family protein [Dyadobacter aurulentus]|uniref:mechanosensitive ion channel family protein n=1 Tax=Dyadobacter sp. UC 10 TaxID=2605428 RepID=UPI0011F290D0|nr:mechanosensitive ion channel family protein [Dyadobacter sp. UC 10]KAA0992434.1 mechanosensitive ion channel family protein [Dyadobacter sp. UC 10]